MLKINSKNSKLNIKKTSFNNKEVIILFTLISLLSILLGYFIGHSNYERNKDISEFISDFKYIENNYYGELNKKELLKKAMETIINEIGDPYSTVIDNSLSNTLETQLNGSYKGLGIEIANTNENNIMIVGIIENSPASKSDLKIGDIIVKLNDEKLTNNDTSSFVEKVKNLTNKEIKLTVVRDSKELNVKITKENVILNSVESKILEENGKEIGYIYIDIFAANTGYQFIEELENLEKKNIESLIIDVRNNSGGHLTAVEYILNNMIASDKIIYQLEEKTKKEKKYSTGKNNFNLPIAILIDGNSASGSEMLAISLKENLNAKLVGKTSFGKGTVQEVQNTENTNIEFKLTTKKWLSPKGNWIHEKGIKPDYVIELDENYFNNPSMETDNQLNKAKEILNK